jgi:nucleotide-binding universal stress UspA family protein
VPGPIILVLDGTANGEKAVPFAVGLAQQAHAELHITQVEAGTPETADAEACRRRLALLVERYAWAGTATRAVCLAGDPIPALLEYCDQQHASLIVAAAQTPPTLRRVFSSQAADALIRFASVPVVVFSPTALAGVQPRRLQRVLVALDGSELAENALTAVRNIAPGSEIILFQAICASGVEANDQPLATAIPLYLANQRGIALEYLNGVADELRAAGFNATVALGEGTWPGATIVHEAAQRQVGLLALATHGRTGFARRALGSCAAEVLRLAHVPVLVAGPGMLKRGQPETTPAKQRAGLAS